MTRYKEGHRVRMMWFVSEGRGDCVLWRRGQDASMSAKPDDKGQKKKKQVPEVDLLGTAAENAIELMLR